MRLPLPHYIKLFRPDASTNMQQSVTVKKWQRAPRKDYGGLGIRAYDVTISL
jgi:hypothetical protein